MNAVVGTIEKQLDDINCTLDNINDTIADYNRSIEWWAWKLKELENQRTRLLKEKEELSAKLVG